MLSNETITLAIKALERYRNRIQEVGGMGWYQDPSVVQNETVRIDAARAELQALEAENRQLKKMISLEMEQALAKGAGDAE